MLNIQGLRPQSRHEFSCELHVEYQRAKQLQQRMLNYQSQEVHPLDKAKALDIAMECDVQMNNIIKQLNRVFAN